MEDNSLNLDLNINDLSFLRKILLGVVWFYKDNLTYDWVTNDGKLIEKTIPISYSKNGNKQFIKDTFFDNDIKCAIDKINGDISPIPSGVIDINSIGIDTSGNMNINNAAYQQQLKDADFFQEMVDVSTRINIIPLVLQATINIKVETMMQSLLIVEKILNVHYKSKMFVLSHNGFHKIPVTIDMTNNMSKLKRITGSISNDQKDEPISFDIDISTYLLVKNRTINYNGDMKDYTVNINK